MLFSLFFFPPSVFFFFPGWRYTVCCVRLDLNATRFEYFLFLFLFNGQRKNRVCVLLFLYMCLCFCGHVCFVLLLLLLSQCLIRGIQCLLLAGDREWETATLKCVFGAPLFPKRHSRWCFRDLWTFLYYFSLIYTLTWSPFTLWELATAALTLTHPISFTIIVFSFFFFLLLNITLFFFFCSSTYNDLWIVSDVRLQYGMNVCLLLRSKSATNGILSQKGFSSGTRTAVRRANAHWLALKNHDYLSDWHAKSSFWMSTDTDLYNIYATF